MALAASSQTAPHRTAKELFKTELVVGATNGIDPEITPRLLNALIGTKFKVVMGYPGVTEIVLAMERGEVQGIADWSVSSIKTARPDLVTDKKINLLMQIALERDPEFPSVPFALDFVQNDADRRVMELYLTQKTVARPVLAPPGVPADRVAALRTAFAALAQDKDFLADCAQGQARRLAGGWAGGRQGDRTDHVGVAGNRRAPAKGDSVGKVTSGGAVATSRSSGPGCRRPGSSRRPARRRSA